MGRTLMILYKMEDQKITFCEIFAENMFNSSADLFLL